VRTCLTRALPFFIYMPLKPYQRIGTPEPNSGQQEMSQEEIEKLYDDPTVKAGGTFKDAVDLVNKVEGKQRQFQRNIRKQFDKKDSLTRYSINSNKMTIELAKLKYKWLEKEQRDEQDAKLLIADKQKTLNKLSVLMGGK